MKKITKKELESIKSLQAKKSNIYYEIASIEGKKHELLHSVNQVDLQLSDNIKSIKDKYGDVKIDPETGEIHDN